MTFLENVKRFFKKAINRISARLMLAVVVILCAVSLLIQYFGRPDSISPLVVAGAVIVPFQEGVNELGGFLFKTEQERLNLSRAEERIRELEEENERLSIENERLKAFSSENRELRELLDMKESLGSYDMVGATVIGSDGTNVFRRFTINKGTIDGIGIDMNVITGDGLVGIVTEAGPNYAIVTSIIEDGMSVGAMTKNGHENCIVTGDFSLSAVNRLRLENALSGVDLSLDSVLVTSLISDKYLPGIVIGYPIGVSENDDHLTQSGYVRTAVDFTGLKDVLVIKTLRKELGEGADD